MKNITRKFREDVWNHVRSQIDGGEFSWPDGEMIYFELERKVRKQVWLLVAKPAYQKMRNLVKVKGKW